VGGHAHGARRNAVTVATPRLLAVSDLHVAYAENRKILDALRPGSDGDWLLVAGDVGEIFADVEWALTRLRERFATVVWAPGNHELWTHPRDPVTLRGQARYDALVAMCRRVGVLTPEDPYPIWTGPGGPVAVVPLFLLYDYTFLPPGAASAAEALAMAHEVGVVCTDEFLLHPDPYPTRDAWCRERLARTEARLSDVDPGLPTVLVNHFPLTREPTLILRYPVFAQWCGTVRTADWHRRFRARAVVYGHLHIPRTLWTDGVPFYEVSLGYPAEWGRRPAPPRIPRQILPDPAAGAGGQRADGQPAGSP
jgi:3',5'-cyclic AMP phosphodiesterase CpdA